MSKPTKKSRGKKAITATVGRPPKDWSDLPRWTSRLMTIQFTDADGRFSKTELTDYIDMLFTYVDETQGDERGGDALRLFMSLEQCRSSFETDDEAEIVRRGIRVGLNLAAFDREMFYRAVQRTYREKGQTTKMRNLETRNGRIRQKYLTLKKQLGDLGARQTLRDAYDLSLETITKIVKQ
jgi:hypothetical protein